jgi:ribosome biogenesis ATPase
MQGLWSAHRKSTTKVNLNANPPTPTVEDAPTPAVPSPSSENTPADSPEKPAYSVNGKRKVRSVRNGEENSSKRTKFSSASKDHSPPSARLSDLGGVDDCVEKVLEVVAMPLCHPEIYLHTGVQPPRGVLLHGPPGCGKTLLANAIAGVRM